MHDFNSQNERVWRKCDMDATPERQMFRDRMELFCNSGWSDSNFGMFGRPTWLRLDPAWEKYMADAQEFIYSPSLPAPRPDRGWGVSVKGSSFDRSLYLVRRLTIHGSMRGVASFAVGKFEGTYHGAVIVWGYRQAHVLDPGHPYVTRLANTRLDIDCIYVGNGRWESSKTWYSELIERGKK